MAASPEHKASTPSPIEWLEMRDTKLNFLQFLPPPKSHHAVNPSFVPGRFLDDMHNINNNVHARDALMIRCLLYA